MSTNSISTGQFTAGAISTNYGFFSTISAGNIYGKFTGDGSLLQNLPFVVPPVLSTNLISTSLLTATNISTNGLSTNYGFFSTISAGLITAKFAGDASLLTNAPLPAGYISISNNVNLLLTINNLDDFVFSTSYGIMSSISAGLITAKFAGDGSLLTNVSYAVPPVLSTTTLSTGLLTASNISASVI